MAGSAARRHRQAEGEGKRVALTHLHAIARGVRHRRQHQERRAGSDFNNRRGQG
jgi:hypothetical protein